MSNTPRKVDSADLWTKEKISDHIVLGCRLVVEKGMERGTKQLRKTASYIKPDCVDQAAWRATMKDAWQSIDHTTLNESLEERNVNRNRSKRNGRNSSGKLSSCANEPWT